MILFPGCKINLGLSVLRRRSDGYHDIESVMIPVGWSDVLEILPPTAEDVSLVTLGRHIDCPPEKNLVVKAYRAMQQRYGIGPVDAVLQKIVPDGAGLGGGSADASAMLLGLNEFFGLNLPLSELADVAATIGADCPFFIYNRPMLATSTGTELTQIEIPQLKGLYLLIVKPQSVSISTAQAYAGITPSTPLQPIAEILKEPVKDWEGKLVNDFEQSIFPLAPEVEEVKKAMLDGGALYASMSGSGSAVFGLFSTMRLADALSRRYGAYPHYLTRLQ